MSHLVASEYKCFEDIRRTRPDGSEYWCARELAPVLDYAKWENFAKVIKRAMIACENSGHDTAADFPEVRKIVKAGATTKSIVDYELSRYACYLIVQNGDPRKEVIALGQTYFAIQTYRQEVADRFNQLDEDSRRLVVRGDIKQWNQLLAEAARNAGVITADEFAVFQNAGYMGLYGGMTVDDIHRKKNTVVLCPVFAPFAVFPLSLLHWTIHPRTPRTKVPIRINPATSSPSIRFRNTREASAL